MITVVFGKTPVDVQNIPIPLSTPWKKNSSTVPECLSTLIKYN